MYTMLVFACGLLIGGIFGIILMAAAADKKITQLEQALESADNELSKYDH